MSDVLLIDVDTQEDFMYPSGKLYVPGADKLAGSIRTLFLKCIKRGIPVISTMDMHDENDEEFKTFPKHCVKGDRGSDKISITRTAGSVYTYIADLGTVPNDETIEYFQQFYIHKKT